MLPAARSRLTTLLCLALVVTLCAGCPRTNPGGARRAQRATSKVQQGMSQQTALFDSIRDSLRTLPESAQMELSPPQVVLNAQSSTDGEEIRAILTRNPEVPGGPANLLVVPRGNVRFRNTVRSGDIVKYYARYDRETMERLEQDENLREDMATLEPIPNLFVAQVVDNNKLLLPLGFPSEEQIPRKLEIWRITDDRMDEIDRTLGEYLARRNPPLGWRPSPDEAALRQLTERLNQWLRQSRLAGSDAEPGDWSPTELLGTLPEAVAGAEHVAPMISTEQLTTGYFADHESRLIQAATWARDASGWARGGATSPSGVGEALFDWAVRNVQLVDDGDLPPRWAWEAMLHGQGGADAIAWVTLELCAQQRLTAAAVTVPVGDDASRTLVGVLDDGQLRLFDPTIGLPLPGAEEGTVASLADIQAEDALLRRLDLPDAPYPLTAEAARQAVVRLLATPLSLSRRAGALESKLPSEDSLVLTARAEETAERLRGAAGVGGVTLWAHPFEVVEAKHRVGRAERAQAVRDFLPFAWRPLLWRGRMQHFRGVVRQTGGQKALSADEADDHVVARRLYMNKNVRPSDDRLARVSEEKQGVYRLTKTLATLFVAQLSHDEGNHRTASRWLREEVFDEPFAEPYLPAVRYNLARAFEETGEVEAAIEALESVSGSMATGARLRAERLRSGLAAAEAADSAGAE